MGRHDPDRWREVIILAGGIKALKEPQPVWDLLEALTQGSDAESLQPSAAWGLRLAAEILAESLKRDKLNRRQRRIFGEIQAVLPGVLGTDCLVAAERVAVGRYLAKMGDPRPEANAVDAMQFCYVPAGVFYLGQGENDENGYNDEIPAGDYDLHYAYWIAQHPVTLAQFNCFSEDVGFEIDERSFNSDSNSPVVYVSQEDAQRFCKWLTDRWNSTGVLPKGYQIALPNEPEWEKASRGGYQIPRVPVVGNISRCLAKRSASEQCMDNPEPQRLYPWNSGEPNGEKLNFFMNVGKPSALGVYPEGVSPYDCHDMVGNVWEWTRSEHTKYPYSAVGTQEWKQRERDVRVVVLRGGSFFNGRYFVRCAVRDYRPADYRGHLIGFRVVLSPLL